MNELTLSIDKTIDLPIQTVYNAWLDPILLAQFIQPMPGMEATKIEIDPREKGKFLFTMIMQENELPHYGEFVEIKKYSKLAFTWQSDSSIDGSIVNIDFTSIEENKTLITLKQTKFVNEETRNNHISGWTNILERLDTTLNS